MAVVGSNDGVGVAGRRSAARHVLIISATLFCPARAGLATSALLMISVLAGCAGSVSSPTVVGSPSQGFDPSTARIGEVSADAGRGVEMTREELDRISHRVQTEIAGAYPGRMVIPGNPPPPGGVNVKLVFTEYDTGNAFARLMLAGLGQIKIAANVILVEPASNQTVGEFEVSKQFAFGGLYGGFTGVEDVEDGFARSVVAIFKSA
jgi:hypothetical protein